MHYHPEWANKTAPDVSYSFIRHMMPGFKKRSHLFWFLYFYIDYNSRTPHRDLKRLDLPTATPTDWIFTALEWIVAGTALLLLLVLTCDSQFIAHNPSKHNCQGFIKCLSTKEVLTVSSGELHAHLEVCNKQRKVYEKLAKAQWHIVNKMPKKGILTADCRQLFRILSQPFPH